jgi:hypothetical protein
MHRGMTTIQVRKSQESKPQPGERFSTLLEIFLRGGVIPSSLFGSDHSSRWKRRLPGNTRDHGIPLVTSVSHNRFTSSRLSWISSRTRFCSALASAEYRPCFQRARRDLANPSGVRGPVLAPPCIRHRPLRIAGARHSVPRRVLAPHLGAVFGSPGGFPFFSNPFRAGVIYSLDFVCVIFRKSLSTTVMAHGSNDRLTALIDIYVSHERRLAELSTVAVQSLHLRREGSQQFRCVIDVGIHSFWRLAFQ